MVDIKQYFPRIYQDVYEIDLIANVENEYLNNAELQLEIAQVNQFILTADENGVLAFEEILNIIPLSSESLDFRKARVLNRLNSTPPFTLNFLKQKLDNIIGIGKYTISIDYENYTLYVESSGINQQWYEEMHITINMIKPANIVFINRPFLAEYINVNEQIDVSHTRYNYKLGKWRLGEFPFKNILEKEVVKLPSTRSLTLDLLDRIAIFTNQEIVKVLINETVEITEFTKKTVTENTVYIEYEVLPTQTDEITNIKFIASDETVLSESNVYIPVLSDVIMKHNIYVKEGEGNA